MQNAIERWTFMNMLKKKTILFTILDTGQIQQGDAGRFFEIGVGQVVVCLVDRLHVHPKKIANKCLVLDHVYKHI